MCIIGVIDKKKTLKSFFYRGKDTFINLYFIICTMYLTIRINIFNKKYLFLSKNLSYYADSLSSNLKFLFYFERHEQLNYLKKES